jgi:hypothetical protein
MQCVLVCMHVRVCTYVCTYVCMYVCMYNMYVLICVSLAPERLKEFCSLSILLTILVDRYPVNIPILAPGFQHFERFTLQNKEVKRSDLWLPFQKPTQNARIPLHVTTTIFRILKVHILGQEQRNWFSHYATNRKVAGLIPDEVIGFFYLRDPSSRTMALGSTKSLTEMSTRNLHGVERRPTRKADNLTAFCEPIV